MAIGGVAVRLDPAHDTLINVNALGDSVPLARFMGGREYEMMMEGASVSGGAGDIDAVVKSGAMLLPRSKHTPGRFRGFAIAGPSMRAHLPTRSGMPPSPVILRL